MPETQQMAATEVQEALDHYELGGPHILYDSKGMETKQKAWPNQCKGCAFAAMACLG